MPHSDHNISMNASNGNTPKPQPVVSIIVPVYNLESSVGDCVKSLLAQTYPSLEIILVDDGSTDKSLDILQRYAGRDPRISVIHQPNAGVEAARFAGINRATGEYVMFVDGDDVIVPDCIETLAGTAAREGSDIIIGDYIRYFDRFGLLKRKDGYITQNITIDQKEFKESYYSGFFGRDKYALFYIYGKKCTKLYQSDFLKNNLPAPNKLKYCEDQLFNCLVFPLARKISFVAKDIYIYKFGGITAHLTPALFENTLRLHSTKLAMPVCEEWLQSEKRAFRQNVKSYLATLSISGLLNEDSMSRIIKKMNEYPLWMESLNEIQTTDDLFFTALRAQNAKEVCQILKKGTLRAKITYKLRRMLLKLVR